MALSESGDEDVVEAVVVVVTDGNAEAEQRNAESGFAGHVGKRAVVVVVVELRRGGAVFRVGGPVLSVNQKNVRPAVVVVIDEGTTRSHGFRQPLLPERSVAV